MQQVVVPENMDMKDKFSLTQAASHFEGAVWCCLVLLASPLCNILLLARPQGKGLSCAGPIEMTSRAVGIYNIKLGESANRPSIPPRAHRVFPMALWHDEVQLYHN